MDQLLCTTQFNLDSYVGGQLLMLTEMRHLQQGRKVPKQIWRRGEIMSICVDEHGLLVELEWVAVKRGGRYFEDDSETIVSIPIEAFYRGRQYSLVVENSEHDLHMAFCFAEPWHGNNVPRSQVKPSRRRL
jgi:hypothetical protein